MAEYHKCNKPTTVKELRKSVLIKPRKNYKSNASQVKKKPKQTLQKGAEYQNHAVNLYTVTQKDLF